MALGQRCTARRFASSTNTPAELLRNVPGVLDGAGLHFKSMKSSHNDQRYIALDFDQTVSFYEHYEGPEKVGAPIQEMVRKVKEEMQQGTTFCIFTARVNPGDAGPEESLDATKSFLAIAEWTQKVFGQLLAITHEKSPHFTEIWDDRGRQVLPNTGVFVTELMDAQ